MHTHNVSWYQRVAGARVRGGFYDGIGASRGGEEEALGGVDGGEVRRRQVHGVRGGGGRGGEVVVCGGVVEGVAVVGEG